jgi:hypothetical protein
MLFPLFKVLYTLALLHCRLSVGKYELMLMKKLGPLSTLDTLAVILLLAAYVPLSRFLSVSVGFGFWAFLSSIVMNWILLNRLPLLSMNKKAQSLLFPQGVSLMAQAAINTNIDSGARFRANMALMIGALALLGMPALFFLAYWWGVIRIEWPQTTSTMEWESADLHFQSLTVRTLSVVDEDGYLRAVLGARKRDPNKQIENSYLKFYTSDGNSSLELTTIQKGEFSHDTGIAITSEDQNGNRWSSPLIVGAGGSWLPKTGGMVLRDSQGNPPPPTAPRGH